MGGLAGTALAHYPGGTDWKYSCVTGGETADNGDPTWGECFVHHSNANADWHVPGTTGATIRQRYRDGSGQWDQTDGHRFNFVERNDDSSAEVRWRPGDPCNSTAAGACTFWIWSGQHLIETQMYIHFENDLGWNIGTGLPSQNELNLYSCATHEFGHYMGLGHSSWQSSSMFRIIDRGDSDAATTFRRFLKPSRVGLLFLVGCLLFVFSTLLSKHLTTEFWPAKADSTFASGFGGGSAGSSLPATSLPDYSDLVVQAPVMRVHDVRLTTPSGELEVSPDRTSQFDDVATFTPVTLRIETILGERSAMSDISANLLGDAAPGSTVDVHVAGGIYTTVISPETAELMGVVVEDEEGGSEGGSARAPTEPVELSAGMTAGTYLEEGDRLIAFLHGYVDGDNPGSVPSVRIVAEEQGAFRMDSSDHILPNPFGESTAVTLSQLSELGEQFSGQDGPARGLDDR